MKKDNQPAPVVPEEMTPEMMRAVQLNSELGEYAASNLSGAYGLFAEFWRVACGAAMLQAEPVTTANKLPELIEGMEVSIDVSTCDADAGNRYFGTVAELSELDGAKNGYILLVQDAKPNFNQSGNSPVIPEGYVMVPKEATEKMLIAGLEEANPLGGLIDWDASRGDCNTREQVQEIFKAMLAAAPQEVK